MIITHTANADGERRVYLGGRSSLECWVEPNGAGWQLQIRPAYCGNPVSSDHQDAWARQVLVTLAEELGVSAENLSAVSFDQIAAKHTLDPYVHQRAPAPRKMRDRDSFLALVPPLQK